MKTILITLFLTLVLSACATMQRLGLYEPSGYGYTPVGYYTPSIYAPSTYTQQEWSNLELSNDLASQRELDQATQPVLPAPTYMPAPVPGYSRTYDPTIMPGNQDVGPALPVVSMPVAPSNPFDCYDVDSCP